MKKKRFYNEGYFRDPAKKFVSDFISPKIANKLNNPIYLLLAYIILFLIGVLIWGVIGFTLLYLFDT